MADGLFGNIFDVRQAQQRELEQSALDLARVPAGRVSVATAGMAGGMLGRGIGQALGGMTPEEEKQQRLMDIQSKFADLDMSQPDNMRKVGNALMREFPDMAMQVFEMAKAAQPASTMTTAMKDIRDIAKFQLNCDFNDPECAKQANQLYIDRKRQTAAEKGAGQRSKELATALTDEQTKIYEESDAATNQLSTVNQSLALLDDIYAGTGGDWLALGKQLASSLGFAEADWAAGEEQFRVNTMKAVMDWIKQTKGAISEKEMDLFTQAAPGLSKTKAGNRLMLQTMREAALFKRKLEDEFNRWDEANPGKGLTAWRKHKREWIKTNGIKAPTKDQIDNAMRGVVSAPKVSDTPKGYTIEVIE